MLYLQFQHKLTSRHRYYGGELVTRVCTLVQSSELKNTVSPLGLLALSFSFLPLPLRLPLRLRLPLLHRHGSCRGSVSSSLATKLKVAMDYVIVKFV